MKNKILWLVFLLDMFSICLLAETTNYIPVYQVMCNTNKNLPGLVLVSTTGTTEQCIRSLNTNAVIRIATNVPGIYKYWTNDTIRQKIPNTNTCSGFYYIPTSKTLVW